TKAARWLTMMMQANGKMKSKDSIKALFQKLQEKVGISGAHQGLKVFRKTSATKLKADSRYRGLVSYFLGHAAESVADKHYAAESQALMNEAVAWLGQQYGLI